MGSKHWTFNLGAMVAIAASAEIGQVIGRAEYLHSEDSYLLRYKAADGRAVTDWWGESALALPAAETPIEGPDQFGNFSATLGEEAAGAPAAADPAPETITVNLVCNAAGAADLCRLLANGLIVAETVGVDLGKPFSAGGFTSQRPGVLRGA